MQGYACFGPHPLTQGTYDLYWIVVDPVAQGHGIGHALLARVEAEVQARGGRLLLVETSGTLAYAPARRFYESSGYRCEATIHDFYAPGDDLVIFSKDLGQVQFPREALSKYNKLWGRWSQRPPPLWSDHFKPNDQHPLA
jgi:ribosomal protein S18 acetylase RimI-like enzyme